VNDEQKTEPTRREERRARQNDASESAGTGKASSTQSIKDRNQRLRAEAAEKRRAKRDASSLAASGGLTSTEMMDDALARGTHRAWTWIRANSALLQGIVVAGIVGGLSWQVYSWSSEKTAGTQSDSLMDGVNATLAPVGLAPEEPDYFKRNFAASTYQRFANDEARLAAAEESLQRAARTLKGPRAELAKVELAGVKYQQSKFDEAAQAYDSLQRSKLAQSDEDVRLRVLEGAGLAFEAAGKADEAIKRFQALSSSGIPEADALGWFHEARVLAATGNKDRAKTLIDQARKRLDEAKDTVGGFDALRESLDELMRTVDPTAVDPATRGFSPASLQDPEQLEKVLRSLRAKAPPAPAPAESPEPSAPEGPAAPADSAP